MKPCDTVRSLLSALVDGELAPLESIAIRRHLSQCEACHAELRATERLKVALHVAGTSEPLPDETAGRLEAAMQARFAAARAEARASRRWLPLAAAAVLTAGVWAAWPGEHARGSAPLAIAPAPLTLDDAVLARLVAVHQGGPSKAGPARAALRDALVAFERLPGSFITPEGERPRVVQVSYADCDGPGNGSSLAVFSADRVRLSSSVDAALDTKGVFLEVVDGVEVRVSLSGDKVFVLLSDIDPIDPSSI